VQRERYPLSFIPNPVFRKPAGVTESSMYDYFVDKANIELSTRLAGEFAAQHLAPNGIRVDGRHVLDVSGGNGHFLKELLRDGGSGVLTEINEPTIAYAKRQHGFPVFPFDFNRHRIGQVIDDSFDLVLLRAAIMFCRDLRTFARDLSALVRPDGLVIVNHSVLPTLGVLVRVQLDEFSYFALRQPETVIADFQAGGFDLVTRKDETDPTLYVYDDDLKPAWTFLHYLYEIRGARALRNRRKFSFPARDRRRSTLIFRKA
jgi:SAM-dependent methyltransferase